MTDWIDAARAALAAGEPAMLVGVVAVYGSAPRDAGARMLVTESGQAGSIGGGNLEYMAAQEAREHLANGVKAARLRDMSLGPRLDQCCGGVVRLLYVPLAADTAGDLDALAAGAPVLIRVGGKDGTLQPASADMPRTHGAPLMLDRECRPLEGPRPAIADVAFVLEPPLRPHPRLLLFGAGHVGRAIAHIAGILPLSVHWIDGRADAFPETAPVNVRMIRTEDWQVEVAQAPAGSLYFVMTHSHPLDFEITAAILGRGDARYCGLIGSETKRARFVKRFRDERGLDEERIARLVCPIGLGGPRGKAPETIAVAVAGEILDLLGDGGR